MLKNTEFLKQVACLFKNVSPTVEAIWRKDPFQGEKFLYETIS